MAPPELCSARVSALTPARSLHGELHLTISPNFCEPMCIPPYGKQVLKFLPALFIYFFLITCKLKALTTPSLLFLLRKGHDSCLCSEVLAWCPCHAGMLWGCRRAVPCSWHWPCQAHARQCELLCSPRWSLLHSGLVAHTQLTAQRARLGWQGSPQPALPQLPWCPGSVTVTLWLQMLLTGALSFHFPQAGVA